MSEEADRGAEFIDFVARALVEDPNDLAVELGDDGRTLELETSDDDRGRVIGRQGRVAKALRVLLGRIPGCGNLRLDIVD